MQTGHTLSYGMLSSVRCTISVLLHSDALDTGFGGSQNGVRAPLCHSLVAVSLQQMVRVATVL